MRLVRQCWVSAATESWAGPTPRGVVGKAEHWREGGREGGREGRREGGREGGGGGSGVIRRELDAGAPWDVTLLLRWGIAPCTRLVLLLSCLVHRHDLNRLHACNEETKKTKKTKPCLALHSPSLLRSFRLHASSTTHYDTSSGPPGPRPVPPHAPDMGRARRIGPFPWTDSSGQRFFMPRHSLGCQLEYASSSPQV